MPEEAEMGVVPVSFELLRTNYPARPNLTPELKSFMDVTPGTPCCVQVSHSLNMAGQLITRTYVGQRRDNSKITINGRDYYYLLAVDELEKWLTLKYPDGESVHVDDAGARRSPQQIKDYLQGRTGILLFRNPGAGFHTELWDGQKIVQRDMNEHACFTQPRVLFWDCGPPQWLTDYMNQQG
jgi:hypothetical protein